MDSPLRPLSVLSLFSGVSLLDVAVRIACPGARTICSVEWEAGTAATLLARMEEASVESHPVWCGDVAGFPAREFAGRVDLVTASFPCPTLSVAGRRKGIHDERWLWPQVVRVLDETEAPLLYCENVSALCSWRGAARVLGEEGGVGGAGVGDSAEGLVSALGIILSDLAVRGFHAEWLRLPASAVGASHGRDRWWMLACRSELANADQRGLVGPRLHLSERGQEQAVQDARWAGADVADPSRGGERERLGVAPEGGAGPEPGTEGHGEGLSDAGDLAFWTSVADATSERERESQHDARAVARGGAREDAGGRGGELADSEGSGREERGGPVGGGETLSGPERGGFPFPFAPPPNWPGWGDLVAYDPGLAPALSEEETLAVLRELADADASQTVGLSRTDALRAIGNSVVPACGAAALAILARRLGIQDVLGCI